MITGLGYVLIGESIKQRILSRLVYLLCETSAQQEQGSVCIWQNNNTANGKLKVQQFAS